MDVKSKVLVLDGGFSNELLKHCSYDVHEDPMWTAKALHTDPKSIVETHTAYLAGRLWLFGVITCISSFRL